ncbi:hypothetical protein M407DRAFT_23084 [Tulasnella calospora MUT 4182]|uniref:DUF6535 domain-containing protein n=1 Tax=Tulasnella calospora MUT 4182 TaxID=1051891 RepID=A0A0C3L1N5_9AGAM|nr:hypothetical protein M407DRAFT_23084 [Tulasnella calospora MUT 4182]
MAAVPGAGFNQIPFEVPNPPREFGQDGGKFYRLYDNLAEEIDEDTTKGLKEQLDGLLIFAGLFAGVNSAFLAMTLPLLLADPADDTNALLAQNNAILLQLMQGRNDTSLSNPTLPSTSFTPSPGIFTVNILFSFSLALAIISAFLAVLGRQWLVYYRKRSGGGADRQRWEQLKRFLGAERWRLELVLDDILPSLLQIGLIIFCASLILYLHILNPAISRLVGIPMGFGLAIFILSAVFTVWDRFCPFQSPLSHLFALIRRWVEKKLSPLVPFLPLALELLGFYVAVLLIPVWLPFLGFAYLIGFPGSSTYHDISNAISSWFTLHRSHTGLSAGRNFPQGLFQSLFHGSPRNEVTFLQVVALKRTISISDDPLTLLCAAANIVTINETGYLEGLWSDETFHSRFLELCKNPYQRMVELLGPERIGAAVSAARLYRGALCHIFLSINSSDQYLSSLDAQDLGKTIMSEPFVSSNWLIPPDMVEGCSPALIEATLASWMVRASIEYVPLEGIRIHITEYSESLTLSSWKLLSLIVYTLTKLPYSVERVEITKRKLHSSYKYPRRITTLGSVETTGVVPYSPQVTVGQPVLPIAHSYPPTLQPIHANPPLLPTVFAETTGQPQVIRQEEPARGTYPIQATPTDPTMQEANMSNPIRYTFIELPNKSVMTQTILAQHPTELAFATHVIEPIPTGQPVLGAHVIEPMPTGPFATQMIGRMPTGQSVFGSPPRTYTYPFQEISLTASDSRHRVLSPVFDISELRVAYTRDVGMTLPVLEGVAVNLARQHYAGDLDCHRILLNILRCAREVTINETRYPSTKVEDKIGLLDVAEQVSRIEDIPAQVRAAAAMLRMDCVSMLRRRFVTGDPQRK